jgi:predicted NBD/HSP70 family sugar kinase/predicted DNA-binding transcriptional regulator
LSLIAEQLQGLNFRPPLQGRGSKQGDIRAYNERLLLSLIRRQGALTRAEIARMTGLSAQAISVIVRKLEDDGLVHRGDVQRGKIGQPSTPMTLAEDGAFSLGVKIGRRSVELVLIDFVGQVRAVRTQAYAWPLPDAIVSFVTSGVRSILASMSERDQSRIAGLGIASPFELWNWEEGVGAPPGSMAVWHTADLVQLMDAELPFPVYLQNDATAACGAEFVFGNGQGLNNYLYLFIGFFIGGGVVLNGGPYVGHSGNAGAIGSYPIRTGDGRARQLIDVASAANLEARIKAAGLDPSPLWSDPEGWAHFPQFVEDWIDDIAPYLAMAIAGSASVIDFSAVVIDGAFPASARSAIVAAIRRSLDHINLQGIDAPKIMEGTVGSHARAIGGACLPFFEKFILTSAPAQNGIAL